MRSRRSKDNPLNHTRRRYKLRQHQHRRNNPQSPKPPRRNLPLPNNSSSNSNSLINLNNSIIPGRPSKSSPARNLYLRLSIRPSLQRLPVEYHRSEPPLKIRPVFRLPSRQLPRPRTRTFARSRTLLLSIWHRNRGPARFPLGPQPDPATLPDRASAASAERSRDIRTRTHLSPNPRRRTCSPSCRFPKFSTRKPLKCQLQHLTLAALAAPVAPRTAAAAASEAVS